MRVQVGRARDYYREAAPLLGLLSPEGRAVYQIMERTYRGMLEAIEQRGYDVFTSRVRLARWQKLGFLLSALPVRWGWF
jgi:phytoene synthase